MPMRVLMGPVLRGRLSALASAAGGLIGATRALQAAAAACLRRPSPDASSAEGDGRPNVVIEIHFR